MDLTTLTAGAAIQCTVLTLWLSSQEAEVCSEILCWVLLPALFSFDGRSIKIPSKTLPMIGYKVPSPVSSGGAWISAASVGALCFYRVESKTTALIPAVTPLLLFAQRRLQPRIPILNTSRSWLFSPLVDSLWGTTLVASFSIMVLAVRSAEVVSLSVIVVVSLLIFYLALTPSMERQGTVPSADIDLKAVATALSSRVLVMLAAGLGIQVLFLGPPRGGLVATTVLGFMKALSWYFTLCTTQHTSSWRIDTAIKTFSIVSTRDPFGARSNHHALLHVVSSFLTLGQVIHLLPKRSRARSALWGFLLIPAVPFVFSVYAIRATQNSAPASFGFSQDHPVEALTQKAIAGFEGLLQSQSKNFTAAYQEYQRRYRVDPPPGFEGWYRFATHHESPIIDDFDMIYDSISPFWRLSGNQTLDAMRDAHNSAKSELWYCKLSGGQGGTECKHGSRKFDRNLASHFDSLIGEEQVEVLRNVSLAVNHLDEPRILLPPLQGSDIAETRRTTLSKQSTWSTLTKHCTARGRPESDGTIFPVETFGLPFVANRTALMDLCQHPEYKSMHGLFMRPMSLRLIEGLIPVLSTGSISTMGDILFPSPAYLDPDFQYDDERDIVWERKRNNLYWAGSTTGGSASSNEWSHFHRQNFVSLAQNLQSRAHYYLRDRGGVVARVASFFNPRLYDVAFTKIVQCTQPYCRAQKSYFTTKFWEDRDQALRSRLVFDLDGNGISGRYYRLLASRSAPLKQTLFREWHDERLLPWVHYIPVSQGMEELPELVFYLTSTETGKKAAKGVAERGREWSARSLRKVDMSVYMYRLMLEMARLQDPMRPAA